MITREYCLPFVGQRVLAQTRDGARYDGILHSVTNDGIYMRPVPTARIRPVSDSEENLNIDILRDLPQSINNLDKVFFPFFFLPFFALAAFRPWGLWW